MKSSEFVNADPLLRLTEVASILGVCVKTVRRLIQRGELPQLAKMGRSSRLFASDVESYQERLRQTRGSLQPRRA